MSGLCMAEFHRLCRIVSPFSATREVAAVLPADDAWQPLIAMADAQYVLPELHGVLSGHGLTGSIPPAIADMLEAYFDIGVGRNADLRSQMIEITQALALDGIAPVWLKGAIHLTQPDWQRSGRVMSDLDLWIPDPEEQRVALARLDREGYLVHPGERDGRWKRSHHYAPRHHPARAGQIEVHRYLVRPYLASLLDGAETARNLAWRDWGGGRIGEPCLEHRIMHSLIQCTMMSTPPMRAGKARLMKYLDLARLLARAGGPTLPPEIAARIAHRRWRSHVAAFLTLAEAELEIVNPFPAMPWWSRSVAHVMEGGSVPLPVWLYRALAFRLMRRTL